MSGQFMLMLPTQWSRCIKFRQRAIVALSFRRPFLEPLLEFVGKRFGHLLKGHEEQIGFECVGVSGRDSPVVNNIIGVRFRQVELDILYSLFDAIAEFQRATGHVWTIPEDECVDRDLNIAWLGNEHGGVGSGVVSGAMTLDVVVGFGFEVRRLQTNGLRLRERFVDWEVIIKRAID